MNNKRIRLGDEKDISSRLKIFDFSSFGELKRLYRKVARVYNTRKPIDNDGYITNSGYRIYADEVYMSD